MRSASSASLTRRIAGCVPSLWMSQRSKCCSGPAFMVMSGGWMIGPAFISAAESASPQSSITPGKAFPIPASAHALGDVVRHDRGFRFVTPLEILYQDRAAGGAMRRDRLRVTPPETDLVAGEREIARRRERSVAAAEHRDAHQRASLDAAATIS